MRKLFQIWLTLTLISILFYTPFYMFTNNALDAVEELPPKDLIPITGTRYDDPEQKAQFWKSQGVDLSKELANALEGNERLEHVEFNYLEGPQARDVLLSSGLRMVEAKADIKGGHQLVIVFGVQPKVFMRSVAQVHGIHSLQIRSGERSADLIEDDDAELYVFALFEKTGKAGAQSVDRMVNRFELQRARQTEHERAQPVAADNQNTVTEPNKQQTAQQYFQKALEQGNWTSEPVAPTPEIADSAQPDQMQHTQQLKSGTPAGNPAPDQIIIFQFDGQPAYCADEGVDGPNCRGDAASWIGQGTYKDYMDPQSSICIATEPDCKLPKYFPEDIRG